MAPGGRRSASESPIRPFYRPVGEAGEATPEPGPVFATLRPAALEPYRPVRQGAPGDVWTPSLNLVGGAGNNTLRDLSDSTYARMDFLPYPDGFPGSVEATFDTSALGWEPIFAQLTVRIRSLTNPGVATDKKLLCAWNVMNPAETVYHASVGQEGGNYNNFIPAGSWVEVASNQWATGGTGGAARSVPTAAEVAAGVKVYLYAFNPNEAGTPGQVDVADVWLTLEGVS